MKNNTLVIVVILVIVVVTIFAFYFVAQSKADKSFPPSTTPRQQEISGWDLITNLVGLFKGKGKEKDGKVEEAEGFEEEGGTFGPPQA